MSETCFFAGQRHGPIGAGDRLLNANLVEDKISVDSASDSVRRAQMVVREESCRRNPSSAASILLRFVWPAMRVTKKNFNNGNV